MAYTHSQAISCQCHSGRGTIVVLFNLWQRSSCLSKSEHNEVTDRAYYEAKVQFLPLHFGDSLNRSQRNKTKFKAANSVEKLFESYGETRFLPLWEVWVIPSLS